MSANILLEIPEIEIRTAIYRANKDGLAGRTIISVSVTKEYDATLANGFRIIYTYDKL